MLALNAAKIGHEIALLKWEKQLGNGGGVIATQPRFAGGHYSINLRS